MSVIKVGASYTDLSLPSPHHTHQKEGGEGFILPRKHCLLWPCVSGDRVSPHLCSPPPGAPLSSSSSFYPTRRGRGHLAWLINPRCLGSKCTLSILPGDDAAGILQTNFFCIPWLPANSQQGQEGWGQERRLLPVGGCSVSIATATTVHPVAILSSRNSWFISSFFPHPPAQLTVSAMGTSMSRTHIPPPQSLLLASHSPSSVLQRPSLSLRAGPCSQSLPTNPSSVASDSPIFSFSPAPDGLHCFLLSLQSSAPCCRILSMRCSQVK